jgi:hypothetical protein
MVGTAGRRGIGLWIGVWLLTACSNADHMEPPSSAPSGSADMAALSEPAAAPMESREAARGSAIPTRAVAAVTPGQAPGDQPMLVRTVSLTLRVRDVVGAMDSVATVAQRVHGFVGTARRWSESGSERATITVRVPAASLDATLVALRALATHVDAESITADDVTRQAVDLAAQLTNLRATETELRALLTVVRQRTQKASDVLEVHQELSDVRGQIEQLTATLEQLTQQVALSSITLTLSPDAVTVPIADAAGWQAAGVFRTALRALVHAARGAATVGIWVAVWALPVALFGGILVLIRRGWHARRTLAAR